MTHFLARLVERARGAAPRVEPIIAPRFAPVPAGESVPEDAALPVVRPAPEAISPAEPAVTSVAREFTQPGVTLRPPRDAEPAPLTAEPPEAPLEMVRESPLVPLEQAGEAVAQRRNGTRGSEPLRRDDLPLVPSSAAPPTVRQANRRQPSAVSRSSLAVTFPNSPNDSASNAPPIVRVTIGRIDVRAAPAPSTPARKPAPRSGPKLTLDAYLKSRQEGAR